MINGYRPHVFLPFATRLLGWFFILVSAALVVGPVVTSPLRAEPGSHRLHVVGGLAGVTQHVRFEAPFWTNELARLSGGRLSATIEPFDRSGLRGQDMLQLMRLGVVPFGTALLALVAGDEPELNAVDLPGLNPDIATLSRTVGAYRDHLARLLRERYDLELLAIYTYPAQVIFCREAFRGLRDLAGRRIRTSSVSQTELFERLGALPMITPFAEIVPAVTQGGIDCAVTGTLSGNEIGLSTVTSHIHTMAVSWGLSIFAANLSAWDSLPADLRRIVRQGVSDLERRIWTAAGEDTERGIACNAGRASCPAGRPGTLTVVAVSREDEALRQSLLRDAVLPRWIERCGPECVAIWNETLAPVHGLRLGDRPEPPR